MTVIDANVTSFFSAILRDFKAGALTEDQGVQALLSFSKALEARDPDAIQMWASTGRRMARDLPPVANTVLVDEFWLAVGGDGSAPAGGQMRQLTS